MIEDINDQEWDQEVTLALNMILGNVKDVMAIAGPKQEMVLPGNLIEVLNKFNDKDSAGMIDQVVRPLTSKWKQWILFNPYRVTKYVLNNFTGDIDALIANTAGRKIFAEIPSSAKEVFNAMFRQGDPSKELLESIEKGVIFSGLTSVEIEDATISKMTDRNLVEMTIGKASNPVIRGAKKYFHTVRSLATFRESVFRYAAYKHYRKEFLSGKSLEDVGFGAARPEIVEALTDPWTRRRSWQGAPWVTTLT